MMNKVRRGYLLVWVICLAVFQVIAFAVPLNRHSGFWIGYVSIMVSFAFHMLCTLAVLKEEDAQKQFYGLSLIFISNTGLAVMLLVGIGVTIIPGMPWWVGVIVCLLVLAFTAVAAIRAGTTAQIVETMDRRILTQTDFIRTLTADAQSLIHRAHAPMLKKLCQKVYEAARYSDPVSSLEVEPIERQIREEFEALRDAVIDENLDNTEDCTRELLTLLKERNAKCKFYH